MKINELKKLSKLLFFTKDALRLMEKNEFNLDSNLKYWIRKGKIIRIKKGRYILGSQLERKEDKELYLEYLANKLYEPSYLSCEYVMNKYGLLTEAVYGISNITTKKTKIFSNKLGKFNYYSITKKLFLGFEIKKYNSANIFIAKKQKAVFDYLYLRFLKNDVINIKVIDELRINWENLTKNEFKDIVKYAKISNNSSIIKLINLICKIYYD